MAQRDSGNTRLLQIAVGAGVMLVGLGLVVGALSIPSAAGYAGIGPNFLPWLVALALLACGARLIYEGRTSGFADLPDNPDESPPHWWGFAWMSAGLLANAALITTIGFIFSCALCFVLAARGLRLAQGQALRGLRPWLTDSLTGVLIAAPVYWMFTQFLAINLPGLTSSGWL